jgi:circadian clock protein KaiB
MRLYVAGQSPNSSQALVNLTEFCEQNLVDRHRIEVVDVHSSPERELEDGVFLTPSLIVFGSGQPHRVVGSLTQVETLLGFLISS